MDLLSLIEVCSVAKDSTLVLAMALTFSQGNAYTVKDAKLAEYESVHAVEPSALQHRTPRNREEAQRELQRIAAQDGAPVMGLLPAPPAWAAQLGRRVEDLLEPCTGLAITSAVVSELEYDCEPKRAWVCVLRGYARRAGLELFDQDVLATLRRGGFKRGASVRVETRAMLEASPLVATSSAAAWGPHHLFISAGARREGHETRAADQTGTTQPAATSESEATPSGLELEQPPRRPARSRPKARRAVAEAGRDAGRKPASLPELSTQLDRLPVVPLPPRPHFSVGEHAKQ